MNIPKSLCHEFEFTFGHHLDHDGNVLASWPEDHPSGKDVRQWFKLKGPDYFMEIRFFTDNQHEGNKMVIFPQFDAPELQFFCFAYPSQGWLQELLRNRILPMYLGFWAHEQEVEQQVNEIQAQTLVHALKEKKRYAKQLEGKIANLSLQVDQVKQSEMGLEQKNKHMQEIMEQQAESLKELSKAYQEQFTEWEAADKQHITDMINMENKIRTLKKELNHWKQKAIVERAHLDVSPAELIQIKMEIAKRKQAPG